MAKLGKNLSGIPAIYRANAINLIVFGAVHHYRIEHPESEVKQTIKKVAAGIGLEIDENGLSALEIGFYKTQSAFKDNGGI